MTASIRRAPLLILFLLATVKTQKILKLTSVECLSLDKNISTFESCQLKSIRQNVAKFSFKLQLHHIVRGIWVNAELLRKYNDYKPFILNATIDACKFLIAKKRNSALSLLYRIFGKYTNINHTCPFEGVIIMENFYPENQNLFIPLPFGDYLLLTNWIMQNKLRFKVNVGFSFQEK